MPDRTAWNRQHAKVMRLLDQVREEIDSLSDLPEATEDVDMRVCFAANSIHGSEALLREADAAVKQSSRMANRG